MGISTEQALDCFRSDDLIGIGMEADAVRRCLHPEGVVTYSIDGCVDCSLLAGAADPGRIFSEIGRIVEMGGTGIVLQGLPISDSAIGWVEDVFSQIKRRNSSIWLHGLSTADVLAIAQRAGLTVRDTVARLRDAGLDSLSGGDDAAAVSVGRGTWEQGLAVHRTAHQLGMPTTAAMIFGAGETIEQRVEQLEGIRQLQEETCGFTAFIPRAFQPNGGQPVSQSAEEPTAVECLKTLAICRILLDNIPNMQSDWATQGLKTLQMGLRFGGNDAGSVLAADAKTTEEDIRRVIRDAGFQPVQRDTPYRTMFLS
jgi:cyclic dehypoxanthinyl futalosine synthase